MILGLNLNTYFKSDFSKLDHTTVQNASNLIDRVTRLLEALDWIGLVHINSGYRSPEHNANIGGKPKSYHMQGKAIDLSDPHHELYLRIHDRSYLLASYDLWMEDGESTPTWVHLDSGVRSPRDIQIFKP